jgi:hypothetical protein
MGLICHHAKFQKLLGTVARVQKYKVHGLEHCSIQVRNEYVDLAHSLESQTVESQTVRYESALIMASPS